MRTSNKNVWPLLDNQKVNYSQVTKELQNIKDALDKTILEIEKSFDKAITKINNIEIK